MTASNKPAYALERVARARRQPPRPAATAAAPHTEHPLLRLQHRAGNAAVSRLLDASAAPVRREGEVEEELQMKHDPALQREEAPVEEEEELAQADHDDEAETGIVGLEGGAVPDAAATQVDSMRGSGSAVDDGLRTTMESALDVDLSTVRVHQNSASDTLARNMTARAFTTGSDIFLRNDVSAADPHLMAHEITHVAQQSVANDGPSVQGHRMTVGAANDPLEHEADRVADAVVSGVANAAPATEEA